MMLRIAAFALNADQALQFGRGVSATDEPDVWLKDLTGQTLKWIDLGTPDPDRLRKACAKADDVVLYAYGERSVSVWWQKHRAVLERFDNLNLYAVNDAQYRQLETMVAPSLGLQATITGGELWLSDISGASTQLTPVSLRAKG